jgi:hypothetical protein
MTDEPAGLIEAPAHARGRAQLARDYAAIMKKPMTRMRSAAGRTRSRTDSQIASVQPMMLHSAA